MTTDPPDPHEYQQMSGSVTDVALADLLTLSGVAAAVSSATGVATALAPHLRSSPPLAVQLLESYSTPEHHLVTWRVSNLTIHGLYLDRVQLIDPNGAVGQVEKVRRGLSIEPAADSGTAALPLAVAPGSRIDLLLRIDLLDRDRFANRPWATVRLVYSRLDQKHPQTAEFVVLLRW